jgi:hypothetical protein
MSKLWRVALGAGLCCAIAAVVPFSAFAQGEKGKDPEWKHGMKLRVRTADEKDFSKDTKQLGLEAFRDENSGNLIYITENKTIAAGPVGTGDDKPKAPEWRHAMKLKVRKAGDIGWDKANKYGVEVFKDENSGNLIYICETGSIAIVPGAGGAAPGTSKAPAFTHGMEVQVRKAGEKDFNKETKKYGIEVFKDENNNNLVYISETGSIAVVTGVDTKGEKGPEFLHGMEMPVRKAGEKEFTKDTTRYGVEVFHDVNNGNLIYIAQTGDIAVIPNIKVTPGGKVKAPDWKYAMDLGVRKFDEDKFTGSTKKYGVEVFRDDNVGVTVAICESGSMALLAGK